MILICANEFSGTTGYHKSLVENANLLREGGYSVAVLSFLDQPGVTARSRPIWTLDPAIPSGALRTLVADGGNLLHRNHHPAASVQLGARSYDFTANALAVLRQVNALLTPDDTIIFTSPLQAAAFRRAIGTDPRRPRTIQQIHGDYRVHTESGALLAESRDVVDRLRTIASGLREQFVPEFAESDVVFIPNAQGTIGQSVERAPHDGVTVVLPASFQERKNQLDAIRAVAQLADLPVRLSLRGARHPANPYLARCVELVERLGLQDVVEMPGFGKESDVYGGADIVLMTSLSEGFGRPLIEAAYHGIPVVTYDFEFGPGDAVEDGRSGFVVPVGDVDALAARVRELAADPELRAAFGRRAKEVFDERFSADSILARHRAMLGPDTGMTFDLLGEFVAEGREPVREADVFHRVRSRRGRTFHCVQVRSAAKVRDVEVDDGVRVRRAHALHVAGVTRFGFFGTGNDVISYGVAERPEDRYYLASTTTDDALVVVPNLRRDWVAGSPLTPRPVQDVPPRRYSGLAGVKVLGRDVAWKLRRLARRS